MLGPLWPAPPLPTADCRLPSVQQTRAFRATRERPLRPRGRLILVDFAPHDATVLGPDHAHRWPGFSDERINGWLESAGLVIGRPVSLPGPSGLSRGALTVKLWRGEQPEPVESYQPVSRADPNLELFQ